MATDSGGGDETESVCPCAGRIIWRLCIRQSDPRLISGILFEHYPAKGSDMKQSVRGYQRTVYEPTPMYVNPEIPDWFVPNEEADAIFMAMASGRSIDAIASQRAGRSGSNPAGERAQIERLLARLTRPDKAPYRGRAACHALNALKECWIHLSNRCNMACTHCLFCSDGRPGPELDRGAVERVIDEAREAGCTIFYFTGGEPFVYNGFSEVVDRALNGTQAHAVILTNAKAICDHRDWLARLPEGRVHLQVSVDGRPARHDAVRGRGAFAALCENLAFLTTMPVDVSLAMTVSAANVEDMRFLVEAAATDGIARVHFLWLFVKGKAQKSNFVSHEIIFRHLIEAYEHALACGISIDNMDILRAQAFSAPGTRFDLNNAGWESLAVGPDGIIYPSAALVFEKDLAAGHIAEGLAHVWKNSPVMKRIREKTLIDGPAAADPFKFVTGGGDCDHSFIYSGDYAGRDPYSPLYQMIVQYLIAREAQKAPVGNTPGFRCRMGERLVDCDADSGAHQFTHSNCVLSIDRRDEHASVHAFYSKAAEKINQDIVNPVQYAEDEIDHIPLEERIRSYGCGSPVLECGVKEGETLADLGSGAGVECFIAARKVGASGRVYGVDMSETMLNRARSTAGRIADALGYANVDFRFGRLERLPLQDDSIDVIISNCVINLSPDKRSVFSEIRRILKPGGRICISDISTDQDIPLDIRYNEKLRGECIGGAMRIQDLAGILRDLGFIAFRIEKRFLYRTIRDFAFYSTTYTAYKPGPRIEKRVEYRGPFAGVITENGAVLYPGIPADLSVPAGAALDESIFDLDCDGNVTNVAMNAACDCFVPTTHAPLLGGERHESPAKETGAVCPECDRVMTGRESGDGNDCIYCARPAYRGRFCQQGHAICESCDLAEPHELVRVAALASVDRETIPLMNRIRNHHRFPLCGPEHHPLIPAIILAVARNIGLGVSSADIEVGIERGRAIPGASCSYWGVDGAAVGAGAAFAVLLDSDPYHGKARTQVQRVVEKVMSRIIAYESPRCCMRECWTALRVVDEISADILGEKIPAGDDAGCKHTGKVRECTGRACPLCI